MEGRFVVSSEALRGRFELLRKADSLGTTDTQWADELAADQQADVAKQVDRWS